MLRILFFLIFFAGMTIGSCNPYSTYPYKNSIEWVTVEGSATLERNLQVTGFENDLPIYLCRVNFQNKSVSGKLIVKKDSPLLCCVPDKGILFQAQTFQVLYYHPGTISWNRFEGSITNNTVVGGYIYEKPYYICRTLIHGFLIPGMLDPETGACQVVIGLYPREQTTNIEIVMRNLFGVANHTPMLDNY